MRKNQAHTFLIKFVPLHCMKFSFFFFKLFKAQVPIQNGKYKPRQRHMRSVRQSRNTNFNQSQIPIEPQTDKENDFF